MKTSCSGFISERALLFNLAVWNPSHRSRIPLAPIQSSRFDGSIESPECNVPKDQLPSLCKRKQINVAKSRVKHFV